MQQAFFSSPRVDSLKLWLVIIPGMQIHLLFFVLRMNSFLASDNFCRLPITFQTVWTQIRTDRTLVLIWIQTYCHSDSVPERFFWKILFWKKSSDSKSMTKYSACKELILKVLSLIGYRSFFWLFLLQISCGISCELSVWIVSQTINMKIPRLICQKNK